MTAATTHRVWALREDLYPRVGRDRRVRSLADLLDERFCSDRGVGGGTPSLPAVTEDVPLEVCVTVVGVCRLFGMIAGAEPVQATFWLLDAPDSLAVQSHQNADGTGVGFFDPDGTPHVDKQPIAAFEDRQFAAEAKDVWSRSFVSHVRHATTGGLTIANTHPFCQHGRLFAHNGVINDLPKLEHHLGGDLALVAGDSDSERYFALITGEIERHGGDVGAGIRSAVRWIVENVPIVSINFVLVTATELWALRYPEIDTLFVLQRSAGGSDPGVPRPLEQTSSQGTRIRSEHARDRPVVIIASERMDDDRDWRELPSGELVHVDASLALSTERLFDSAPRPA